MAQFTFIPFETFITARPVKHHSSRVYLNKEEGLELSKITLTFPDTQLGASSETTLVLTNIGDVPITITGLDITGSVTDFSVNP